MDKLASALGLAGGGVALLADAIPANAGTLEFIVKQFGPLGLLAGALWLIVDKLHKSGTALQGDLKESGAKLLEMTTRAVTAQERGNAEIAAMRSDINSQTTVIREQTGILNLVRNELGGIKDRCPGSAGHGNGAPSHEPSRR